MSVTIHDLIALPLTRDDVLAAVREARRHTFRDNLRRRSPIVQFDSKVRGYLGELGMRKWLATQGIKCTATNTPTDYHQMDTDLTLVGRGRHWHTEVKTSLIPSRYSHLEELLQQADIKLIKRTATPAGLRSDLHLQVLYDLVTDRRDDWLNRIRPDLPEQLSDEQLYTALRLSQYEAGAYFAAWIDRERVCAYVPQLATPTWGFGKRQFWVCRFREHAMPPQTLVRFLNGSC